MCVAAVGRGSIFSADCSGPSSEKPLVFSMPGQQESFSCRLVKFVLVPCRLTRVQS